jgi:uncharacterized membrane protein (UPF0127 family)
MSRRPVVLALTGLVVVVVVVVGAVLLWTGGDDSAPDAVGGPLQEALAAAVPARAPFAGLTEVRAAIGDDCLRLAVADSLDERAAGLRGHAADLGPYDGMLFVFEGPTSARFTMSDVSNALDIAFFTADGDRTTTIAMKPCPDKAQGECPVYGSDALFTYAVETKPGELPSGSLRSCPS